MKRNIILSLLFLLLLALPAKAQYYSIGDDPGSLKWSSLQSKHFKVIYPTALDSLARVYLFAFEKYRNVTDAGLGVSSADIPLVLHPYTSISNASVAWAPKRVDILTTPPYNRPYTNGWPKMLALHEGRHVTQMTHFTRGFWGGVAYVLGEQAAGAGIGIHTSGWFREGDAVDNETDWTNAGRGRNASFLMGYKAAFLNGDIRNYDRWEFGSYKHYTPDEYAFGYLLQTGMQYETGFFAKTDIYNYIIEGWYKIGSMNRANIAVAGIPLKEQWNRTVERYTNKWAEDDSLKRPFTLMDTLVNKSDRYYHSYSSPLLLQDGNLLALYSSYAEATSLMEIYPDGNSKKLTHFGSNISKLDLLSEREIIWSEVVPDLRWSLKNSSILRSYNLDTGKFSNLTQGTRYYSPAVSHDKKMVAVVEYRVEGGSNAVLLNSADFSIISAIPAADGGQIKEVAWLGSQLYATIIQDDGVGLYFLENGKWTTVVEPQGSLMVNLRGTDNLLYFRGDSDGTDNIYAYIPSTESGDDGQFKRLTNSRFGAFTPYLDGDTLYYMDYDITGYTPVKSRVDLSAPLSGDEWPLNPYNAYFDAEKGSQMAKAKVPMMSDAESRLLKAEIDTLQPEKFRKAADLIHFHSWAPIYMNPNRIMNLSFDEIYKSASLGVTALAQNLLGTATLIAGYSYHGGFHSGHINFNYSGLYPILEFSADLNDRHRRIYSMPKSKTDTLRSPLLELSLRAYVPFNLGRSGVNSVVTPFIEVDYKNDIFVGNSGREWHNFVFRYGVSYYRKLPVAHSAIIPRWGFGLSAQGYMMPTPFLPSGSKMESLWMLHLYGYLPGITPIQGIKLSATFQGHRPDESSMRLLSGNLASLPRGYKGIQLESYAKFSFDYAIPIYIGDFNITSITYFKRLKLIPFADYAFNSGEVKRMFSFGTALMVDARLLRLPEVSFGVRYARFMKPAGGWGNDFQFVVSTGL